MKIKEINVFVPEYIDHDDVEGIIEDDGNLVGDIMYIDGVEFYRAKLIIEIPEKKIEITESQLTEAFRRSQGAGHFLKELIKQLGLEND